MLRDLRLALRTLRRQPGFTAVAVLILALGLGATTAMFSVTNALVLRPLPYPHPEQLVRFYRTLEKDRGFPNPHTQAAFEDYRRLGTAFQGMTAYVAQGVNFAGAPDAAPRRVSALQVSASFFAVHGLAPQLGRDFRAGDDRPGAPRTVMLSWGLWQSAFAGDPGIVGRSVHLDDGSYTVIGVMPRAFNDLRRFWARVELWYPLQLGTPPPGERENFWLQIVARLKPEQTVAGAQAEMDGLTARLNAEHGTRGGVQVIPLGETGVNQAEIRATTLTLWLAVLVLLIASFNLAGLQLTRLASRHHEHAIRAALGAGRARLIRPLLLESFLLCLAGTLLGLLVARWVTAAISARLVLFGAPAGLAIELDTTVLGFAAVLMIATTLAVGLYPGWLASRSNLAEALRAGGHGATDRGRPRMRAGLVVAEMALALVLLAAATLFVRGLDRFVEGGAGWRPDGLLAGTLVVPRELQGKPAQRSAFYERVRDELSRLPGVESVSLSEGLPLSIFAFKQPFLVEGRPAPAPGQAPLTYLHLVSPGYFATLGMSLERGRDFGAGDGPDGEPVAIVNQALARALWPGQDPLGQRIGSAVGEPRWSTVVGVVSDAGVASELREPITRFRTYQPLRQTPLPRALLAIRIRTAVPTALREIRASLAALAPSLPPFEPRPVRDSIEIGLANLNLLARILLGFAALGLLLAALGIYALFAGFVVQRRREIGVRLALGARTEQLLWLILGRGLRLAVAGAALGLAGALLVMRVLTATATELPAHDPAAVVALTLLLVAVALFACWLPARRAAGLDPMAALRSE